MSCTYRSDTTLAATTTALASAGTGTPEFTVMVTLTSVPWGWIESTVPTGTPSTRTVEPG